MKDCVHCPHPEAAHGKAGKCRIGGCPCPGFDDGLPRQQAPGFRRVAFDIPDGYIAVVQLMPAAAAPQEEADASARDSG